MGTSKDPTFNADQGSKTCQPKNPEPFRKKCRKKNCQEKQSRCLNKRETQTKWIYDELTSWRVQQTLNVRDA